MDLRRHGLKTNTRLHKSNTQKYLKRNSDKRNKFPTLEERKAGGIYGFINKKKKVDPFKVQLDFLTSGYVHNHGSGGIPKQSLTSRGEYKIPPQEQEQLEIVRNQFIK